MSHPRLAVRINRTNANHHLWDNHGTWWMHYTLHLPDFTKRRVRQSLGTRCVKTARGRRDAVLAVPRHQPPRNGACWEGIRVLQTK